LVVQGRNRVEVGDVLIGEVWVCSGQSNMEWPVSASENAEKEVAEANDPRIRMFTVVRASSPIPATDCDGRWQAAGPETVGRFSAVGYFFARELRRALGVPVGMINASWGGTPAEAWTPLREIERGSELGPLLARLDDSGVHPAAKPSYLFNGMIAPLIPYRIRGVIWYQGESNVGRAWQYRTLFPTMVQGWRKAWGRGDFPFYYVQIAPYRYNAPEACAELREAQAHALRLRNTGMVVTMDIGDVNDIHPRNKQEVGRRLALWALAKDYGKNVTFSGPLFEKMTVVGHEARISFRYAEKGLATSDGKAPSDFQIAGADRKFVPAHARIDGSQVVVWADGIEHPVAVRYAWSDLANPNLVNGNGLPASPFRTDDWPAVTRDAK
jgi:sialate O-acetylesterase